MDREEHIAGPSPTGAAAALRDATERLAEAAASGVPGALPSALLDALEDAAGLRRATLWSRAGAESALVAGPTAWMQLRSRGPILPSPDGAGDTHVVLHGAAFGALVYERETFDDGAREEREDAAEALFRCADVLASADLASGALGEVPPPFSIGDALPGDEADDRAA